MAESMVEEYCAYLANWKNKFDLQYVTIGRLNLIFTRYRIVR